MIDVCGVTEKNKIKTHIDNLNTHREKFDELFAKDRKDKEAKVEELVKQKERDIALENEQQAEEIAAVEAECEAIEQECAVLQKRNNAIMLKLRRKLLDSENIRRKLLKQRESTPAKENNI
ncbi:uncharacterized protein LOC119189500 [Manduca sexta]|uniref:uncharacterized protein LOC119189500 n=1 Tax=Manduca sexta TaxID=7130 RepID=UPI00188E6D2A|nr:uncharacterized protein LOC119189500 [Manduca sexta]